MWHSTENANAVSAGVCRGKGAREEDEDKEGGRAAGSSGSKYCDYDSTT